MHYTANMDFLGNRDNKIPMSVPVAIKHNTYTYTAHESFLLNDKNTSNNITYTSKRSKRLTCDVS